MRFLTICCALLATPLVAQDGMRDGDIRFSKDELTEILSDQVLEFYTKGLATYRADGSYDYRYSAESERIPGVFEVMEDSRVCMVFVNGFERCDYLVQAGERLVMVIENGERYPVRAIAAIE